MAEHKVVDFYGTEPSEARVEEWLKTETEQGWSLVAVVPIEISSTKYHRHYFARVAREARAAVFPSAPSEEQIDTWAREAAAAWQGASVREWQAVVRRVLTLAGVLPKGGA